MRKLLRKVLRDVIASGDFTDLDGLDGLTV